MKIKAAQLDLARQKETVDTVLSAATAIRSFGMNTLVLYLEGRIKTPTFPYLPDDEAYTPEEMRRVVRHGRRIGLDVIPVVPNLGHVDMFLRFPELARIAEHTGRRDGRFFGQGALDMACPSRPDAQAFFDAYYREVAEIFPSRYFHAGLDESWELGICDACGARAARLGGVDALFAEHVGRTRNVLRRLGKTMLMWDDMFEIYPAALDRIPRDIVLVNWCYHSQAAMPLGHFLHLERRDWFAEYARRGIPFIFATGPGPAANIRTFTEYARPRRPLGGLVTLWERQLSFNDDAFPMFAYAAALWRRPAGAAGDDDRLLDRAIARATGLADPAARAALAACYRLEGPGAYRFAATWARGEISAREEAAYQSVRFLRQRLEAIRGRNPVVEELRQGLVAHEAAYGLRAALAAAVARGPGTRLERRALNAPLRLLAAVHRARLARWANLRPGIPATRLRASLRNERQTRAAFAARLASATHLLRLRCFLPDVHSLPFFDVDVADAAGRWTRVAERAMIKPPGNDDPYYEVVFPFSLAGVPSAVRLSGYGYGGQGFTHVRVDGRRGRAWAAAAVRAVTGVVRDPDHLLVDDRRWCFLGVHDTRRGFQSNDHKRRRHSVEVALAEMPRPRAAGSRP